MKVNFFRSLRVSLAIFASIALPAIAEPFQAGDIVWKRVSDLSPSQESHGGANAEAMVDALFKKAFLASLTLRQLRPYYPESDQKALDKAASANPAIWGLTPDQAGFGSEATNAIRERALQVRLSSATVDQLRPYLPPDLQKIIYRLPRGDRGKTPEELGLSLPAYALDRARLKVFQEKKVNLEQARPYLTAALQDLARKRPVPVYLPPRIVPRISATRAARRSKFAMPADGHHAVAATVYAIDHLGVREEEVPMQLQVEGNFQDKTWGEFARAMEAAGKGYFTPEVRRLRASDAPPDWSPEDWRVAERYLMHLPESFRDPAFSDSPMRSALGNFFYTNGINSRLLGDYMEFFVGEILESRGVTVAKGKELDPAVQERLAREIFERKIGSNEPGLSIGRHEIEFMMRHIRPPDSHLPKENRVEIQAQREGQVRDMFTVALKNRLAGVLQGFGLESHVDEFLSGSVAEFRKKYLSAVEPSKRAEFLARLPGLSNIQANLETLGLIAYSEICRARAQNQ